MKFQVAVIMILSALSCSESSDLEKERGEILALLNMERKAHFEKNTALFISEFSHSMVSINRGIVTIANNDQRRERIEEYFKSVDFVRWDDIVPPKITFSEDATMAYAIVQKQVILSLKGSSDNAAIDTTDFAWVAIYRRTRGEWKVECNVSTNK